MLRLLHTADVHLGARHTDLGERASLQRERQFAAFRASIDLAISERVDLVLIAGDLFDSNTQPRRSVERVASELGRLSRASIRTVIIPGTHDAFDGASIYRAYDLGAMARATGDWIVVLTPQRSEVFFESLDAIVCARVFDTKRAPESPLAQLDVRTETRATWKIGMVHGALAIPAQTDGDDVAFTEEEIARTGLDYLAIGHWHSRLQGNAGGVAWAYSGAPEPVAVDQDGAGEVLLVTLDERPGSPRVTVVPRRVGKTHFATLDLDVSGISSQPQLIDALARHADPNAVLDVRLTGLFPDDLDVDLEEVERELATSFLRLRVRDLSIPGLSDEPLPPADTVLGAFIRLVEEKIAALETGRPAAAGPAAAAALGQDEAGPADGQAAPPPEAQASATEGGPPPVPAGDATTGEVGAREPELTAVAMTAAAPAVAAAVAADGASEPAVEDVAAAEVDAEMEAEVEAALEAAAIAAVEPAVAEPALAGATVATAAGSSSQAEIDELSELREVLRLGRHLLEGRTVTL